MNESLIKFSRVGVFGLFVLASHASGEEATTADPSSEMIVAASQNDCASLLQIYEAHGSWKVRHSASFLFTHSPADPHECIPGGIEGKPSGKGSFTCRDQWTPLTAAVINRKYEAAYFLIGCGADVNELTGAGYSPLWFCVVYGRGDAKAIKLAELLLCKGADPHAAPTKVFSLEDKGLTPAKAAESIGNAQLVGLFRKYSAIDGRSP